jgi:hypothetical protein
MRVREIFRYPKRDNFEEMGVVVLLTDGAKQL